MEVEDDDAHLVTDERLPRLRDRRGLDDLEAGELEVDPAKEPDRGLVVQDKDTSGRRMPLVHGEGVYWASRRPNVTLAHDLPLPIAGG